ncbi:MAG: hypothetical protein LBB26_03530 [Puniceicoccales bacterium]|jgi:hypothetical protein|nr:hypothetical protein [Puniceicoccales bacterium]
MAGIHLRGIFPPTIPLAVGNDEAQRKVSPDVTPVTYANKVALLRLYGYGAFFAYIFAIFISAKTVNGARAAAVEIFREANEISLASQVRIDHLNFFTQTECPGAVFVKLLNMSLAGESLRPELEKYYHLNGADADLDQAGRTPDPASGGDWDVETPGGGAPATSASRTDASAEAHAEAGIGIPITSLEALGGEIVEKKPMADGTNSSVCMVTLADGREYVAKSFPDNMAALRDSREVTIAGCTIAVPGPLTMAQQCFGVQITAPETPEAYAVDVISRNLVCHGITKYFAWLGDPQNPTIPIVKSHAVRVPRADGTWEFQLFMEKAAGVARESNVEPIVSGGHTPTGAQVAEVLRQEIFLQITDYILGQKDRQSGNVYFAFGTDGESAKVTGVDNDLCLPEIENVGGREYYDKRPREFPYFIDSEMARAIELLEVEVLGKIMRKNGRDPSREPYKTEFALMARRVFALKEHVRRIRNGEEIRTETKEDRRKCKSSTLSVRKYGEILPSRSAWNTKEVVYGQIPINVTVTSRSWDSAKSKLGEERRWEEVSYANVDHGYIPTHMGAPNVLQKMYDKSL